MSSPIKVLLVDDSPVALAILGKMLALAPDITVVGTAPNGNEALRLIPRLDPSVICVDYQMPGMNGLELIRQIMTTFPRPVLVISSVVNPTDAKQVFALLEAGAIDVISKPQRALGDDQQAMRQLISKIRIVAGVFVFTGRGTRSAPPPVEPVRQVEPARPSAEARPTHAMARSRAGPIRIVAIGGSTGGPQALSTILPALPATLPVPVVCVQHISKGFLAGLVEWLDGQSALTVKTAENGETPRAGTIYFPPEERHLEVDSRGHLWAGNGPPVDGHKPSVTATFTSLAKYYGPGVLAVLLTGMGRDGGAGLLTVQRAGGDTVAQNEATCVVYGMPKYAVELGAAREILALDLVVPHIIRRVKGEE